MSQKVVNVGVLGAAGRMGREVCRAVEAADGLNLVAGVDPGAAGETIADLAGIDSEVVVSDSLDVLVAAGVDVAIDFTHVDVAKQNMVFCAQNSIHSVIGTSGFAEDSHDEIASLFTSSNCLIVANFSISAVLLERYAAMAAPYFDTAEIIELHHNQKVDAPSGTSVAIAEQMAAASDQWADDPTTLVSIDGARGAEGPGGIRLHSVRMDGMVGHQEVLLGTTGQTLTLRQDSYNRTSFMPGVVLAAKKVGDIAGPGLSIGLQAVMD